MKILVIFTGGTIGSTVQNGYITPKQDGRYQLLERYRERQTREVEFVTEEPYTVLSENSTGEVLQQLADSVSSQIYAGYDGIIITHGTDTLQYSAAMLGYIFAGCEIPVVLVSSNYVLGDDRSNGLDNFYYAVEFIAQHGGKGVFVSYRNRGETAKIHRGTRLVRHLPYSDDIVSIMNQHYGEFWEDRFVKNPEYQAQADEIVLSLPKTIHWDAPILQLDPYPGMKYPEIGDEIRAVIHHSYHAGTICSESPDLGAFLEKARERHIPVFFTGAENGITYESMKILRNPAIHRLPKASPLAMYMKLWLLLSNGLDSRMNMGKCLGEDLVL